MNARAHMLWTFAITSIALFMVTLDNLVASVFGRYGGYESGQSFVDGLSPAIYGGAGVVFAGALAALAIPRLRPAPRALEREPAEAIISRCACACCWDRSSSRIWK